MALLVLPLRLALLPLALLPLLAVLVLLPLLVLRLLLVLVLFSLTTLLLWLLLLLEPFHQIQVGAGVGMSGVRIQSLFVGGDRVVEPPEPRQCVAAVVIGLGTGAAFEVRECARVVAAAVARRGPPVRVRKPGGGGRGVPGVEQARPLLILALPESGPVEGLRRVRRQDEDHGQRWQQPTASEGERGERQQEQQEPGPFLPPLVGAEILALQLLPRGEVDGARGGQCPGVGITGVEFDIAASADAGELGEPRAVESRHRDGPAAAGRESAGCVRHRGALCGADPEHGDTVPGVGQGAGCGLCGTGRVSESVGDQDDLPVTGARLGQEFAGHGQRPLGAAGPKDREQVSGKLRDLSGDGLRVARERGDDEWVRAEGDQGDLTLAGGREQVQDLEAGAGEPRGAEIRRVHARGEVEQDHPFGRGGEHRLRQSLAHRPGQRGHRQQPAEREQPERQAPRLARGPHQEVRQQVRVHQPAPDLAPAPRPPERREEPRERQQCEEPPGPEKLPVGHRHPRPRAQGRASITLNASAAPAGHMKSDSRGR